MTVSYEQVSDYFRFGNDVSSYEWIRPKRIRRNCDYIYWQIVFDQIPH